MIELTPQNIQLHVPAKNKAEAIRAAGQVLVETGNIAPGYIDSMLGRERQANTYLGNGIAIPHGMQKDRDLIYRTGVSVVQVPDGVEWNPGQIVRIVVGIAARSDEHLGILSALTDVLDDAAKADRLAKTKDPADVIAALTRKEGQETPAPVEELAGAHHVDVKIVSAAGLHARPATYLVDVATPFQSEIRLQYGTKIANAKALASLLKLGVERGETVRLLASGPDAQAALKALREAIESGLGETEEAEAAVAGAIIWAPESRTRTITGVAASPGLAIGKIFQFRANRIVIKDAPGDPDTEKSEFKRALETAREQLAAVYDAVQARAGKSQAAIFRAHQALLSDSDLFGEVCSLIDHGHSAAWSWQQAINERIEDLRQLHNERLAGRAVDLSDVGQRVLQLLAGTEHGDFHLPEEPVVLVAEDLTPADTAQLDPRRILGFCTALGGPTSHTSIIARSLGIPAIVGAGPAALELTNGVTAVLDGVTGRLYVEPDAANLESARRFQIDLQHQRDEEFQTRYQPAVLTDGYRVEVVANIGKVSEAAAAVEAGAEGVGLLRTEFLFLNRTEPPGEQEQFEAYTAMTQALNGLPLIIRTLDIGGDKVVPYLAMPKEENPFLGVRGIRLCLQKPELFIPQLRAIYRASATGPVKIMFPMVATLEDLRQAKEAAGQVRAKLGLPPVEIGIMVEVPSTALMAGEFAEEVDFFSIGTNDLTQYALAIDRMHPALARQADSLHPAVLRLIDLTVRAADKAGKWAGVCGGAAGDPRGAIILAGLGVRELSMSLPSIAAVKAHLRAISLAEAKAFAKEALGCKTAGDVHTLPLPA